jgi:hypothetical protein
MREWHFTAFHSRISSESDEAGLADSTPSKKDGEK